MTNLFEWIEEQPLSGDQAADQAIAQVAANADGAWWRSAERAIRRAALDGDFTTDDVWYWLEVWEVDPPHEPRALGAVMRSMRSDREIISTGQYVKSMRPECHSRPVMVWRAN